MSESLDCGRDGVWVGGWVRSTVEACEGRIGALLWEDEKSRSGISVAFSWIVRGVTATGLDVGWIEEGAWN